MSAHTRRAVDRMVVDRMVVDRMGVAGEQVLAKTAASGGLIGRVLAVTRGAVYVDLGGEVLAFVGPEVEPGPVYVHLDHLGHLDHLDHLERGAAASVGQAVLARRDGFVLAGPGRHLEIVVRRTGDGRSVPERLVPGCQDGDLRAALSRAAPLLGDLAVGHVPDLDLNGGAGAADAGVLSGVLSRDGLASAAAALAGRGIGLTPAGDDVLAGLLLVAAWAEPSARPRLVRLADAAASHQISRAFLRWAARGATVTSATDLLTAALAGDRTGAGAAYARLATTGHTSGRDLAHGLAVGAGVVDSAPWPEVG